MLIALMQVMRVTFVEGEKSYKTMMIATMHLVSSISLGNFIESSSKFLCPLACHPNICMFLRHLPFICT